MIDWVKDYPMVIAINAFHNTYTSMIPDSKIIEYLYKKKLKIKIDSIGNQKSEYSTTEDIEFDKRKKPSGFFSLEHTENISAVIFINERPIWKFNRMGYLDSDADKIIMQRYGLKYDPNPASLKSMEYNYHVKNSNHIEDWKEGVSIFHNPNAKLPLNRDLFKDFRQIWNDKDGKYDGYIPDFSPFTSQTIMFTNE